MRNARSENACTERDNPHQTPGCGWHLQAGTDTVFKEFGMPREIDMKSSRFAAAWSLVAVIGATSPVLAQSFEFVGGLRQIGANDTLGYGSLTYNRAGAGAEGLQFRLSGVKAWSTMFGTDVSQGSFSLTAGHAWQAGTTGSFAIMAGPTYVNRTAAGGTVIDAVGYLVSAEYAGFVGQRGFAGLYTEYSSPDQAFFTRAFYSYYLNDRFGIGPDLGYLVEPNFTRGTLGVRASYVVGASVFSATIGQAITNNALLPPSDRSAFLELQIATRF